MVANYDYIAKKANRLLCFSDNEPSALSQSSMTCAGISMPITKVSEVQTNLLTGFTLPNLFKSSLFRHFADFQFRDDSFAPFSSSSTRLAAELTKSQLQEMRLRSSHAHHY